MIEEFSESRDIISKMRASEFQFCLTGSRYFGPLRSNADWDFFVQNSPEVRKFLMSLGFEILPSLGYVDSTITCVMRHFDGFDVQLIKDYKIKKRAQEWLAGEIMQRRIDRGRFQNKIGIGALWDEAIMHVSNS